MITLPELAAKGGPWERCEVIGDAVLFHGDAREVLPLLPPVDLVLTDPPYGIEYGKLMKGKGDGNGGLDRNRWKHYEDFDWDDQRPEQEVFDLLLAAAKSQIIWGGNYFTDLLPPTMQWLVWDKGQRDFSLADCEFAWSSQRRAARIFTYTRPQALQDGREHPTQKPIALMEWCIKQAGDPQTILDPFMGSGTTGVACARMGLRFTGIERERKYFDIAVRRIEQAYAQPRLFEDAKFGAGDTAVQGDMLAPMNQ